MRARAPSTSDEDSAALCECALHAPLGALSRALCERADPAALGERALHAPQDALSARPFASTTNLAADRLVKNQLSI